MVYTSIGILIARPNKFSEGKWARGRTHPVNGIDQRASKKGDTTLYYPSKPTDPHQPPYNDCLNYITIYSYNIIK